MFRSATPAYTLADITKEEIIRNFVTACRAVKGKQIILTTHSPALINTLTPHEVSVVWRRNGETHVAPLAERDPESVSLWANGSESVFELLDTGWLPEAVPGGRE
jgi:hypothetical protein